MQYSYMVPPDAIRFRELITDENVLEPITIDGKSCFRIKVEGQDGLTIWNTFDANSKLLTERTDLMGTYSATTEYSYRDVDGILFVDKLELYSDSAGVKEKLGMQTFDTIEINVDVDVGRLELMKVR